MISLLLSTTFLKPLTFDGEPLSAFYAEEKDIPEAFKSLFTKNGDRWVLNVEIPGIDGVKSFLDFEKMNNSLRKERGDHKLLKDKMKLLGDRSIEDVIALLDRIPELEAELEAAGGGDPDKIEKLVEARIKSKLAPVERELTSTKTALETANATLKNYEAEKVTRTIHDAVRSASAKAKLLPEALEDALMLAERVFEVTDDGKVLVKENSGYGLGLDAAGWFTELQQKRPHWWGPSGGGGAGGNRTNGSGITNPWTSANWNMTEQGRIMRENPAQANALATAAGTKVGGLRPKT